ncbi:hypothetical protein D7Z54_14455 [Salibacterium salarium]|uniref:Phage conserved hypothetical protein C-terminal domain-containing protein n=1 Tax=Salibacterium salarium TaxID=284579 RepID=A0A3R9QSV4_9BACI|nr:conserved phage C-terminal domain-containing protein [Salibacterium salarium]RSL32649.1 hypothetical protein D7Z54_14455 [Salibacterium salarium]
MAQKSQGWIKVHRQLLYSSTFQNEKTLKVFMYCLLKATHQEIEARVGRQKVKLLPGQFVFGRKKAALELDMKESAVRDQINILKSDETIDIKSTNKYSVVTVANWGFYQETEDNNDSRYDSKSPADNQQITTYKNVKNDKNEKNKESVPFADIINHLNSKTGKKFSAKSEANKKLIRARYNEGRSKDDFIHVIDVKCEEWLKDPKMSEYLRPTTLFGQEKFEKYVNQKKQQKKPFDPRDKDIAIQKWMQAGGDPDEFSWDAYNNWNA